MLLLELVNLCVATMPKIIKRAWIISTITEILAKIRVGT